jgi:adenylosuccinate lyase
VLAEAIQTLLRKNGVSDAYEQLKEMTRGRRVDLARLRQFIADAPLAPADRAALERLTPATYIGLAAELARRV